MMDVTNTHERSRETANKSNAETMRTQPANNGEGRESIEPQARVIESPRYKYQENPNVNLAGGNNTE